MSRVKDKIVGVVKPFAQRQGIQLLSVERELQTIGKELDAKEITVEQAVTTIDAACARRECFLERKDRDEIMKALKRLM